VYEPIRLPNREELANETYITLGEGRP